MILENMTNAGFGRVMEVAGYTAVISHCESDPEIYKPRFFARGEKIPEFYVDIRPETLRFQEYEPGGMGHAQYMPNRYARCKWVRIVSEERAESNVKKS